jgi:hypothetical protein
VRIARETLNRTREGNYGVSGTQQKVPALAIRKDLVQDAFESSLEELSLWVTGMSGRAAG